MSAIAAFIIGLVVGWIVEWVIDWVYWRRRKPAAQPEGLAECRSRVTELEQENASYKSQLASLQAEVERSRAPRPISASVERAVDVPVRAAAPVIAHDRLEDIQGVTPEMARRLNEAGINTFADLGALSPLKLKEIFGGQMPQPGTEVAIIQQARLASGMIKKVDNLEDVIGIGPVIAKILNNAGIFTFAELAALSAADLRGIVGQRIERLADEEKILAHARQLADEQNRGG